MKLLIPGPVTTMPEVRAVMARDFAPWDNDFRALNARVKQRLLAIAHGDPSTHVALAIQGCGHFAIEAALRTFLPPGGQILVPVAGSYAERMVRLAREAGRVAIELPVPDGTHVSPAAVAAALVANPGVSHVGLVYSETSSGMVHDPVAIGEVVRAAGKRLILDAVSAFGALPIDVSAHPELDAFVFTPNKCLEGMPGMAFAVASIARLLQSAGNAGSWSLDLADIHAQNLRAGPGVFRFTPAAQVIASLDVALDLFDAEGGQPARLARYRANAATLHEGMEALGLNPYVSRQEQGPIVLNVAAPNDPAWNLQAFVDGLKSRGFLISNFYNTASPSFRVGCIGAVDPDDMREFLAATDATLRDMNIRNRAPTQQAA